MDEIRKVKRVMAKADPAAPHETLLVIDANTGPERGAPGEGLRRRAGSHGPRGHQARRHRQGRRGGGDRARASPFPSASSASARRRPTCVPFVAKDYVEALFA
jgi:fused signal recognition particle receptor